MGYPPELVPIALQLSQNASIEAATEMISSIQNRIADETVFQQKAQRNSRRTSSHNPQRNSVSVFPSNKPHRNSFSYPEALSISKNSSTNSLQDSADIKPQGSNHRHSQRVTQSELQKYSHRTSFSQPNSLVGSYNNLQDSLLSNSHHNHHSQIQDLNSSIQSNDSYLSLHDFEHTNSKLSRNSQRHSQRNPNRNSMSNIEYSYASNENEDFETRPSRGQSMDSVYANREMGQYLDIKTGSVSSISNIQSAIQRVLSETATSNHDSGSSSQSVSPLYSHLSNKPPEVSSQINSIQAALEHVLNPDDNPITSHSDNIPKSIQYAVERVLSTDNNTELVTGNISPLSDNNSASTSPYDVGISPSKVSYSPVPSASYSLGQELNNLDSGKANNSVAKIPSVSNPGVVTGIGFVPGPNVGTKHRNSYNGNSLPLGSGHSGPRSGIYVGSQTKSGHEFGSSISVDSAPLSRPSSVRLTSSSAGLESKIVSDSHSRGAVVSGTVELNYTPNESSLCQLCQDSTKLDQMVPCSKCFRYYHTHCFGSRRIPFSMSSKREISLREQYVSKVYGKWQCENCPGIPTHSKTLEAPSQVFSDSTVSSDASGLKVLFPSIHSHANLSNTSNLAQDINNVGSLPLHLQQLYDVMVKYDIDINSLIQSDNNNQYQVLQDLVWKIGSSEVKKGTTIQDEPTTVTDNLPNRQVVTDTLEVVNNINSISSSKSTSQVNISAPTLSMLLSLLTKHNIQLPLADGSQIKASTIIDTGMDVQTGIISPIKSPDPNNIFSDFKKESFLKSEISKNTSVSHNPSQEKPFIDTSVNTINSATTISSNDEGTERKTPTSASRNQFNALYATRGVSQRIDSADIENYSVDSFSFKLSPKSIEKSSDRLLSRTGTNDTPSTNNGSIGRQERPRSVGRHSKSSKADTLSQLLKAKSVVDGISENVSNERVEDLNNSKSTTQPSELGHSNAHLGSNMRGVHTGIVGEGGVYSNQAGEFGKANGSLLPVGLGIVGGVAIPTMTQNNINNSNVNMTVDNASHAGATLQDVNPRTALLNSLTKRLGSKNQVKSTDHSNDGSNMEANDEIKLEDQHSGTLN